MLMSTGRAQGGRACTRGAAVNVAMLLLVAGGLTGCDGILEVTLPGTISEEMLDDPAMAPTLVNSVIGDFECAFTNYVVATGHVADETLGTSGFLPWEAWDRRLITSGGEGGMNGTCEVGGFGVYRTLQAARFQAADVMSRIEGWPEAPLDRPLALATLSAYEAYSYTLLGEGFCEMAIDESPLLTPAQVLEMAEDRFTRTLELATAANASEVLDWAYLGRARVRLKLGRLEGAVADAEQVPEGFVKYATRSLGAPRRENRAYSDNHRFAYISVHPNFQDLEVDGVPDPRVPAVPAGRLGQDLRTPLWLQLKYASESDPIAIAKWEEAQLIIAEAEGGQRAVNIINNLRERHGLPGTFSSSDDAEILAQILDERRRELYQEGHRLNDLVRHDLPFPMSHPVKDLTYGVTTCLPLPDAERLNNPNIGE